MLVKWKEELKIEPEKRRVALNFWKGDWRKYKRAILRELSNLDLSAPPKSLQRVHRYPQNSSGRSYLQKIFRPNNVSWMNGELKSLIRERNRLRQDLNAATRPDYVQKRKEVAEKTAEASPPPKDLGDHEL